MVSVGEHPSNLPTPALCLDLARFESNLESMTRQIKAAGKHWRPHASCHMSPTIALRLLEHGAIGLTCSRLQDAEVFAAAGVRDLLIAHSLVGAERVQRIARLRRHANVVVSCDHYVQADQISSECIKQGVTCRALVEINLGMDRTGVRPGHDTLELARGISRLPGLTLAGFMGYEGPSAEMAEIEQRRESASAAFGILTQTRHLFRQNGLCCDIIIAGGSDSLFAALKSEALTEVSAGSAIFGGRSISDEPHGPPLPPALTILATVVSRPAYDRAVLDAGATAMSANPDQVQLKDQPGARVTRIDCEHTVLELKDDALELRIGDRVELIVSEPNRTTHLHQQYFCVRNDRLEEIWPIASRGMIP